MLVQMPLPMSRPWKHSESGVYWLRKGVPEDLRALVGKREEKRSLGTRDPIEAKRKHTEALAEIEERWANLRAGAKDLTEREAHELAAFAYERWFEQHRDNPSLQTVWNVELGGRLFAPAPKPKAGQIYDGTFLSDLNPDDFERLSMEMWCLDGADERLKACGFKPDEGNRRTPAKAIAAAVQRASLMLERLANGEAIPTMFSPAVTAVTLLPPTLLRLCH
ncbi:hypothetical protein IVB57_35230 [Bradyrhizobium sp. CW9]|uniref:DUF6538 domain-containing protein n=1 Tax=unclassified Bradyrhizobium TaxID=2631580 RepID=UPI00036E8E95|nr:MULTISPECIES: DUF6538 domain-containing protein [unclassified Bradyrhizobium]MCK1333435.1 hypothetical protein [Bradyrhizobium sp. CW9]